LTRGAKLIDVAPAFAGLAVMILWAAHNGGYDTDTWYWGALMMLSFLVVMVARLGVPITTLSRTTRVALIAFALYVAWSYLSITWAASPGDALTGSNRALLYLLLFAVFALTRWNQTRALGALLLIALGIGVIALFTLVAMATGHHVGSLFSEGRLVSPTGYFNSSAALFTTAALLGVGLAVRKELPAILRGLLLAISAAGVHLALLAQSRGWLFTLPLVLIAAIAVSRDRLRTVAFAILPVVAGVAPLHALLGVFRVTNVANPSGAALTDAAKHAGRTSLAICVGVLVLGSLLAAADQRIRLPQPSIRLRRIIGTVAVLAAFAVAGGGALAATHGHPFPFIKRQWHGFTHPASGGSDSSSSHFATVGSGRYDAWRVALDALLAHPLGGLGQDNFADYYIRHRRTGEELQWVHSFEFRLLAHTGLIGFALFAVFLAAALSAAIRTRIREPGLTGALAGIALLPLIVWLIHGSVDWFWEMPALSGPTFAFLALAGGLRESSTEPVPEATSVPARPLARRARVAVGAIGAIGAIGLVAATVALGFPYLSVRAISRASAARATNTQRALSDLSDAASLNPLSPIPGRLGGTIALQTGQFLEAERRFRQSISRERGGWFAWFGDGLAASSLGDNARAYQDFTVAERINSVQPAIKEALARVNTTRPLTAAAAFRLLVLAH
jgi:O-Antigen ligase